MTQLNGCGRHPGRATLSGHVRLSDNCRGPGVTMTKMSARTTIWLMTLLAVAPFSFAAWGQASAAHDREFWRSIVNHHYAVPEGQSVFPLLRELSGYLGSTDPEFRDGVAYSILAAWIVEKG